jgi:sugar phosphate isomerase/epimerase
VDTFHFHAGGSTWAMMDALDPSLVCHVRLTDADPRPLKALRETHRALPGDGVFPFVDFLQRLESIGYDGLYSILLARPDYWQWDPRRVARVSLESIAAVCAEKDELAGALDYV